LTETNRASEEAVGAKYAKLATDSIEPGRPPPERDPTRRLTRPSICG